MEVWKILRLIKNPKQENVKIGLIQEKQWVESFLTLLKEDRKEFMYEDLKKANNTLSAEVLDDELRVCIKGHEK